MKKRPLFWIGICLTVMLAGKIWSVGGVFPPRSLPQQLSCLADGSELVLYGQAADCALQPEGMRLFLKNIRISSIDNSEISQLCFDSIYQIYFNTDQTVFLPGDEVKVSGVCSLFSAASNPGQFDAQEYYSDKNVLFSLEKAEVLAYDPPDHTGMFLSWKRSLYRIRYGICRSYQKILGTQQSAALAAITLGEKQMLDQDQKLLYQEGGISHILAVSGLHISFIGMGLYRLLRRCCVPLSVSAVCSACILVSYIEMVGWSASSFRACVMFLLWLGAELAGRAYDRLTALAAAAICILLRDPGQLQESAFQLSFLAVLSLSTLAQQLPEWIGIRTKAGKTLWGSLALQAGMLPCTLFFFYQIPVWSLFLNLAVVPLMTFVLGFGMLGGILGIFAESAGVFFSAPCHYLLVAMEQLCRLEQKLPSNLMVCGRPDMIRIFLYYAILGVVSFLFAGRKSAGEKRRRTNIRKMGNSIVWLAVIFVCWLLMQPSSVHQLEVTCLDVGQGDGILIRVPSGKTCMIDGGSSSANHIWKYRISQTVKYYGIREIDWWFVSHADSDHISGLLEYLQDYESDGTGYNAKGITLHHLVLPVTKEKDEQLEQLRSLALGHKIQVHSMGAGDMVWLGEKEASRRSVPEGEWFLKSLAPDLRHLTGDQNQDSLVLLLQYDDFRMLFTGDMGETGEKTLLARGIPIHANVLKAGHHGSRDASSEEFLSQVAPQAAVISCAEKNRYGHPAPETMKRLQEAGCLTICTSQAGAVRILSDGARYELRCFAQDDSG